VFETRIYSQYTFERGSKMSLKKLGDKVLDPEIVGFVKSLRVSDWTIARNRFEAVTIISQSQRIVLKFVRKRNDLVNKLILEVRNLKSLEAASVYAPRIVDFYTLDRYKVVVYRLIVGDVNPNKVTANRVALLAKLHRRLHRKLAPLRRPPKLTWDAAIILKPFCKKSNEFTMEQQDFAKGLKLRTKEKKRDVVSFIHSDSHFSNIVFQKNRAVLIDYAEAGYGSIYFEIAVVLHALLYQKKIKQKKLIQTYLNSYFGKSYLKSEEIPLIEKYVRLRFLEAATWHLLESHEDQVKYRKQNSVWIKSCFNKAKSFALARFL
jgi:Ser/Thr protein kinase RdoA (MazF antagonist)